MAVPLIPLAGGGALSEAAATIIEKNILRKRKIGFLEYDVYGFLAITLMMIPLLFFFWGVSAQALELKNILILLFVVVCSAAANLLTFYALKWEKVTEIEPLRLFQPLFVIIIAFILYSSERQSPAPVLIAALVASLALVFSHIRKHHFQLNKYLIAALLGSLFFAIELAVSKSILGYYSYLSFYFIRCASVFAISFIALRPSPKSIDKKSWLMMAVASAIWIGYRMLLYSGYQTYGIIFTTLLFILAPVFIYLLAALFLKEKLDWRNILATIIIIACIAYAISASA